MVCNVGHGRIVERDLSQAQATTLANTLNMALSAAQRGAAQRETEQRKRQPPQST